jgi:hypothetical protein
MTTERLQRRHFSSTPLVTNRANRLPHGQRRGCAADDLVTLSCAGFGNFSSRLLVSNIVRGLGRHAPNKKSPDHTFGDTGLWVRDRWPLFKAY